MIRDGRRKSEKMKNTAEIRCLNMKFVIDKSYGDDQTRFADALGIKNPNLISRYANGKKNIGPNMARKMENVAGLPKNWLDNLHPEVTSPDDKTRVTSIANTKGGDSVRLYAPLITWTEALSVKLGERFMAREPNAAYPCPVESSPDTFCLRVHGVSMEPALHSGDIIFVDPAVVPTPARFVVAKVRNSSEALLRQFVEEGGKRYLKTLNPAWPDSVIEIGPGVSIIGTVIFRGNEL